jgi:hypothetical protein
MENKKIKLEQQKQRYEKIFALRRNNGFSKLQS